MEEKDKKKEAMAILLGRGQSPEKLIANGFNVSQKDINDYSPKPVSMVGRAVQSVLRSPTARKISSAALEFGIPIAATAAVPELAAGAGATLALRSLISGVGGALGSVAGQAVKNEPISPKRAAFAGAANLIAEPAVAGLMSGGAALASRPRLGNIIKGLQGPFERALHGRNVLPRAFFHETQKKAQTEGKIAVEELQKFASKVNTNLGKNVGKSLKTLEGRAPPGFVISVEQAAREGGSIIRKSLDSPEALAAAAGPGANEFNSMFQRMAMNPPLTLRQAVNLRRQLDNLIERTSSAIAEPISDVYQRGLKAMRDGLHESIQNGAKFLGDKQFVKANAVMHKFRKGYEQILRPLIGSVREGKVGAAQKFEQISSKLGSNKATAGEIENIASVFPDRRAEPIAERVYDAAAKSFFLTPISERYTPLIIGQALRGSRFASRISKKMAPAVGPALPAVGSAYNRIFGQRENPRP